MYNVSIAKNILMSKNEELILREDSIYNILKEKCLEEINYGFEIVCILNGKVVKVNNYDIEITKEDKLEIVVKQNVAAVVPFLIDLAIQIAISYVLMRFFAPENSKPREVQGTDVYTMQESQMRVRMGEPVPEIFGTFKTFPGLIAPAYYRYENNEQYMYLTALVGKGSYTFEEAYISSSKIRDLILDNNLDCSGGVDDSVIKCLTTKKDSFKCVRLEQKDYTSINCFEDMFYSKTGDNHYRYIVYENPNISNFDLQAFEPTGSAGTLTDPVQINKEGDFIDKVEIDVVLPNGLYSMDTETGDAISAHFMFRYIIFRYDSLGNKVQIAAANFEQVACTSTAQRHTISVNLPGTENYFIQFINYTAKPAAGNSTVNTYQIERIKGFVKNTVIPNFGDTTCVIFRLKSGAIFSQKNSVQLGLKVKRKEIQTLDKAIAYIWQKGGFDYLELKGTEELTKNIPINCIINEKNSIFDSLNNILRARRLILVPTLNGFQIKEDAKNPILSYIFDKSKIKKDTLSLTYNFTSLEQADGFKALYVDAEGENKSEVYPTTAEFPEDQILIGVVEKEEAITHAKLGYNKKLYQTKTATFETELEGFIPEIQDKIGITEFYLKDSYSAQMIGSNENKFILDNEIFLSGTETNYCIIRSNNTSLDTYEEIIYSGSGEWVNEIEISGVDASEFNNYLVGFIIGTQEIGLKEYIVQKIEPTSENSIKITAQNYDERMYN